MLGPAYFIPGVGAAEAKDSPKVARLKGCGSAINDGWVYFQDKTREGTMAFWLEEPMRRPDLEEFREPRECDDGLLYYCPKVLPSQAELARTDAPVSTDVRLWDGRVLSIAVAYAMPRAMLFGTKGGGRGDALTEYARVAEDVRRACVKDAAAVLVEPGPEVFRVVYDSIRYAYRVTPELLTDLQWVSTRDLAPILEGVWGIIRDPKNGPGAAER